MSDVVFACDVAGCAYTSASRQRLHQHKYAVHRARIECDLCRKLLKPKHMLQHVREVHHGQARQDNRGQKTCGTCGKEVQASYIRQHERVHVDDKPHHCLRCFSSFKRKGDLHRHIDSIHLRFIVRCIHCNATFTFAIAAAAHLRNIHNITAPYRPHYSGPEPGPNTVDLSTIPHKRTVTQAMALDAVRSAINLVVDEECAYSSSTTSSSTTSSFHRILASLTSSSTSPTSSTVSSTTSSSSTTTTSASRSQTYAVDRKPFYQSRLAAHRTSTPSHSLSW